ERREAGRDFGEARAEDNVEVEVAVLRLEAAVVAVIGVDLLPEVEGAAREIVVEQADAVAAAIGPHGGVEGDVLVERIAALGILAHGVDGAHAQAPAVLVGGPA